VTGGDPARIVEQAREMVDVLRGLEEWDQGQHSTRPIPMVALDDHQVALIYSLVQLALVEKTRSTTDRPGEPRYRDVRDRWLACTAALLLGASVFRTPWSSGHSGPGFGSVCLASGACRRTLNEYAGPCLGAGEGGGVGAAPAGSGATDCSTGTHLEPPRQSPTLPSSGLPAGGWLWPCRADQETALRPRTSARWKRPPVPSTPMDTVCASTSAPVAR
jgi:hypothetical protein